MTFLHELTLDSWTNYTKPMSKPEAPTQGAFDMVLAGRTSVVIAHRLSTILHANQILVVNDGRIVERGPHADLLEKNGLYADLYRRQFLQTGEWTDRHVHI
jgi:ABC-type transport system involved in Fe-S cluster assembly fused permease/ATPase subunit